MTAMSFFCARNGVCPVRSPRKRSKPEWSTVSQYRPRFHSRLPSGRPGSGPSRACREDPSARAGCLAQNIRRDPHAIIPNAQQKAKVLIGNFYFYIVRPGMVERVAQCFTGKTVDLIAQHGIKVPRLAFNDHIELHAVVMSAKLLTRRSQGLAKIVGNHSGGAQVFYRAAGIGKRLISLIQRHVECPLCIFWPCGQHVLRSLQMEHQALKALQQRIMEFARNARPLIGALFHPHVQLS